MWLHSQNKYGTLLNLSEVKYIYRELDTFNKVWELKAFTNNAKNSDGIVILGTYSTEERANQVLAHICKTLKENIIYVPDE